MAAKKKRRTITNAHIAEALMAHYGNMAAAAEELGTSRQAVFKRVKDSKQLTEARQAAQEQALDLAENSLLSQIRDKNTAATIFFLKTIGKKRGYIEPQHLVHSGELDVKGSIKTVVILPEKEEL
jgi:hypothetical protein